MSATLVKDMPVDASSLEWLTQQNVVYSQNLDLSIASAEEDIAELEFTIRLKREQVAELLRDIEYKSEELRHRSMTLMHLNNRKNRL